MAMKENQIKDFKVILKLFIEIAASSNGSLEWVSKMAVISLAGLISYVINRSAYKFIGFDRFTENTVANDTGSDRATNIH